MPLGHFLYAVRDMGPVEAGRRKEVHRPVAIEMLWQRQAIQPVAPVVAVQEVEGRERSLDLERDQRRTQVAGFGIEQGQAQLFHRGRVREHLERDPAAQEFSHPLDHADCEERIAAQLEEPVADPNR
jgi:hypothetical protein